MGPFSLHRSIPPDIDSEVKAFLKQRREYMDQWFFLVRVSLTLGIIGYLTVDTFAAGGTTTVAVLLLISYLLANVGVKLMYGGTFEHARWGYAGLDVLFLLILRHAFQFEALVDPNATMVGLLTLVLIAYALYCDPKLSIALGLASLAATILTLCIEAIELSPPDSVLLTNSLAYRLHPLRALLLFSYLGGACLITHRLAARLFDHLLSFSIEQEKRAQVAITNALERERREQAEDLDHLKRDFISILSQELRAPVIPLIASLRSLQDIEHDTATKSALQEALGAAERIEQLVQDYTQLTDLLTLEDERLQHANIRLSDLLDILREWSPSHQFILRDLHDLVICTDPRLAGGALLALLHSVNQDSRPKKSITLTGHRKNGSVVMRVYDPDHDTATSDKDILLDTVQPAALLSSGLELVMARHSMRRMGGSLHIDHEPHSGTTFSCTFPGKQAGADWLTEEQLRDQLAAFGL